MRGSAPGTDVVVAPASGPSIGAGSTVAIVQGFDAFAALQVGGVTALLAGLTALGALRLGLVEPVDRRSLTRRRALVVGLVGAVGMLAPWLLIGVQGISGLPRHERHPGPPFAAELSTAALPPIERFYVFDAVPALVGMVAIFGVVAIVGSAFRRSVVRSEPGAHL